MIHPRVFERLGVAPFPAPPTSNFSGMTGQPVKIQAACFLRVTHPEHPEERKQDRQLFYVSEEGMDVGVTLSKSCCRNLGIIPPHFPRIAKADEEEEGKRMEEMKQRLREVELRLKVVEKLAEERLQQVKKMGGGEVEGRRRRRRSE